LKYVFPIDYPVPPFVGWEDIEQAINKPTLKDGQKKAVPLVSEPAAKGVKTQPMKKD
jgi:hypothetical protein